MVLYELITFIVPVVVVSYIAIYAFKLYLNRKIREKIPSPPGHWFLGNLVWFLHNEPEDIFTLLRETAKEYWPIYRFRSPYISTINILHPNDFEMILSPMKHLNKSKVYEFLKTWLGEGLLTSGGQKWQTRRKILTPAFHFNILQQYLQVFNSETQHLVDVLAKESHKPHVDIVPFITQMTLQSISETAMGLVNKDQKIQEEYRNSVFKMGKILLARLSKPWLRLPFIYCFSDTAKAEKETVEFLHQFSYTVIKEREAKILEEKNHKQDSEVLSYSGRKIVRMLDLLLQSKINDENIDLDGIREEVDTFMFEGHDTTSTAISFLLLNLACYPEIQEKTHQEITEILGAKQNPTYSDLLELKYTEMVIKETLRLYPSVPFISRIASEDFVTHTGYRIPKGTILHMHIYDLHRDPRIYSVPEKFEPERFLPENTQKRHPFAYLPFSAGPRNCIGQRFAMLELKSVLCGILRKFKLEAVDKPEDLQFLTDLVLRTKGGIKIKFKCRS